jgi:NADPH:quinone reductase-like Zn-dependent oxidoreductase
MSGDATTGTLLRKGGCAEFATVSEAVLAPKPPSLTFEQSAAVPLAAITALKAPRSDLRPLNYLLPGLMR